MNELDEFNAWEMMAPVVSPFAAWQARAALAAPIAPRADADTAGAKLRYFLEAWEMNGVGRTIATVQDSPGTVVTITVDDLKAAAGASNERADAEKDAARYRWLKENAEEAVVDFWSDSLLVVEINDEAIDAAILAANGEKK